jgi:arsenate reductase
VGVNPKVAKVMEEVGVDISEQWSKHVDELREVDFDFVVTLCDNAREQCPVFPASTRLVHRSFEDPAFMLGSEEEIMRAFRKARDDIRVFVETMPESLQDK